MPAGSDAVRERFFASLKALERAGRGGGDCERLLAFHHTVDCGFVLTGRGGDFASFVASQVSETGPVDVAPSPWDEVLEIIRKGDHAGALARCRQLVKDQPYHRSAYIAGAMLANFLGEHNVAEDLALLGSRYFPKDGAMAYYLGLARLRLGSADEAEAALAQAVELAPDMVVARTVLAVTWLARGRRADALRVLEVPAGVEPDDRRAATEASRLRQWMLWRRHMLGWGLALVLFSVLATAAVGLPGLVPGIVGAAIVSAGWFAFQRQLDAVTARQHFEEISQGLRRLHRTERKGAPVS